MKYLPTYKLFESFIKKDKDTEMFKYYNSINTIWNMLMKRAQKFFDIHFDLENNESTGDKRTLYITKDLRVDQPIKYKFNAELFEAGGDWEEYVLYFRVQLDSGIFFKRKDDNTYIIDMNPEEDYGDTKNKFICIPDNENGNCLIKNDNGSYRAYQDGEDKFDIKDLKRDSNKAWKWLENMLTKIVDERHNMID